jgi:HK97 family phage major capsid protein
VNIEEERQLLRGTAGGNEIVGVFNRSGLLTYARGTVDNNAIAVLKAAAGLRGSAFLDPDILVMHPSNWLATRLLADTAGQFLGGGPFQGPYGSGQSVGIAGAPMWGLRVALSSVVGAGTALIGSSQAARIYRRGGVSIEATNSHSDWFTKNISMIRAEERLGLAVYRPGAWVQVTGLA